MKILHIIYQAGKVTESTPNLTINSLWKKYGNSFVFSMRKPLGLKGDYPILFIPLYKYFSVSLLGFLLQHFTFSIRYVFTKKSQNFLWIKTNLINLIRFAYIFNFVKKNNIALVNCFFGYIGEFFVPIKSLLPVKTSVSFHGIDISRHLLKSYNNLQKHCDAYFVLADYMKKELVSASFNKEKINVVKTGLDFSTMPLNKHVPRKDQILFVGRLVEKKAVTDAILAFERISKKHTEFKMVIVGDGPLMKKAQSTVERLKLNNSIVFLGELHYAEVYQLMLESKIFFLPSKTSSDGDKEGTPVAIIEAQTFGLPIVSTYHSGIPEIVLENRTAFLSNEGDIESFAAHLERLITDVNLWKDFSDNATAFTRDNFDINKRAEKVMNYFLNL